MNAALQALQVFVQYEVYVAVVVGSLLAFSFPKPVRIPARGNNGN